MGDRTREEYPYDPDFPPEPRPRPRPGSREIYVTSGESVKLRVARVGITPDVVIEEELDDYKAGFEYWQEHADDPSPEAYARQENDMAVWEREKLLAVIRPQVGGDPVVTRFDGGDEGYPIPTTEGERMLVELARAYGVECCRAAIVDRFIPGPAKAPPRPLTTAEQLAVDFVRRHGEGVTMDRLLLAGPYGVIASVMDRIGRDGMDVIRRMLAEGRIDQDGRVAPRGGEGNLSP